MTTISAKDFQQFEERASAAELILKQLEASLQSLKKSVKSKQDIIDSNQGWEVWYWPTITARANFVRLIFAEADVPFKDVSDVSLIMQNIYGKGSGSYRPMAVPFIKRDDFYLSQTVPIVQYLSKRFDLLPESSRDQALAQMVIANVNDMGGELSTHQNDSAEKILAFVTTRLQSWLDILEKPLTQSNGQLYYFDNRVTCVDLCVFNSVFSMVEYLGEYYQRYVVDTHPVLVEHYARIGKRANIAKLVKRQKDEGLVCWPAELNNFHICAKVKKVLDEAHMGNKTKNENTADVVDGNINDID